MQQHNRAAQEGLRAQRAYEPGAVPGPSGSCGLRLIKRRCLGRLRLRAVYRPLVASIRKRSSDSPLKFFQVMPASVVTSVKVSPEPTSSAADRQNKMNREDAKSAKKDE